MYIPIPYRYINLYIYTYVIFFKLLYYLYKLSAANLHFRINSSVCLKLVLFYKFCIVFKHLSVLYNLSLHLFLKVYHLNIPYKNICK